MASVITVTPIGAVGPYYVVVSSIAYFIPVNNNSIIYLNNGLQLNVEGAPVNIAQQIAS